MKKLFAAGLLVLTSLGYFCGGSDAATPSRSINFFCSKDSAGTPITVASVDGDDRPVISWEFTGFSGWSPERRCRSVSDRMQQAFDQRRRTVATGLLNKQKVLCLVSRKGDDCNSENIMYTLRDNDTRTSAQAMQVFLKHASVNFTGDTIRESGNCRSFASLELLLRRGRLEINTVCPKRD